MFSYHRAKDKIKALYEFLQSDFNKALVVTTTKTFIGGSVFADLNTATGLDEPAERQDLYSQCGVGTAPSYIVGTYRAVQITESALPYVDGEPRPTSDSDPTPSPYPPTVTTKVCVVLDSLPGVTKCLVDINNGADATKSDRFIAVYDGSVSDPADLDQIVEREDLHNGDTAQNVDIFQAVDNVDANNATSIENVCSLFGEGGASDDG